MLYNPGRGRRNMGWVKRDDKWTMGAFIFKGRTLSFGDTVVGQFKSRDDAEDAIKELKRGKKVNGYKLVRKGRLFEIEKTAYLYEAPLNFSGTHSVVKPQDVEKAVAKHYKVVPGSVQLSKRVQNKAKGQGHVFVPFQCLVEEGSETLETNGTIAAQIHAQSGMILVIAKITIDKPGWTDKMSHRVVARYLAEL